MQPTGTIYDTTKHEFEPLPNTSVTCRYCERSFSDSLHHRVDGERWIAREESAGEN